VLVLNYL